MRCQAPAEGDSQGWEGAGQGSVPRHPCQAGHAGSPGDGRQRALGSEPHPHHLAWRRRPHTEAVRPPACASGCGPCRELVVTPSQAHRPRDPGSASHYTQVICAVGAAPLRCHGTRARCTLPYRMGVPHRPHIPAKGRTWLSECERHGQCLHRGPEHRRTHSR